MECVTTSTIFANMTPSDYHVFHSLQNVLNDKTFTADEDIKPNLELFFVEKDKNFFECGIMKLKKNGKKSNKIDNCLIQFLFPMKNSPFIYIEKNAITFWPTQY